MKREFHAGDVVRIRDWEDMEQEFGLNEYGNIACRFSFTDEMGSYCGEVYTIEYIDEREHVHFAERHSLSSDYNVSFDMIELVEDSGPDQIPVSDLEALLEMEV